MNYSTSIVRSFLKHTQRRLIERYNLSLSYDDLFVISNKILSGKGVLKAIFPFAHRAVFKIDYSGRQLVLVFDMIQLCPVTALPHKALKRFC